MIQGKKKSGSNEVIQIIFFEGEGKYTFNEGKRIVKN